MKKQNLTAKAVFYIFGAALWVVNRLAELPQEIKYQKEKIKNKVKCKK
mgnify:CR=1 FL=1